MALITGGCFCADCIELKKRVERLERIAKLDAQGVISEEVDDLPESDRSRN